MVSEQRRVMLTGATGFLGSWVIAGLLRQGISVLATDIKDDSALLDRLMKDDSRALLTRRYCDVTDAAAVDATVAAYRPSALIHLAALQIPDCRAKPALCVAVNITGHINLLEAARRHGVSRFIYTSSIAAKPRGPANAPANLYGVFKKTDEEISRLYWEDHGISSLGLRPYIGYGVGRDEGESSAITKAIRSAAYGQPYTLPFRTRGCFQYASEIADIFVRTTAAIWEGALLSDLSDTLETTDDVISAIRRIVPDVDITASETQRVGPASGFDTAPLRSVIGDWPAVSLEDGVRQTVEMYRSIE